MISDKLADLSKAEVLDKLTRQEIGPLLLQLSSIQSMLATRLLETIPNPAIDASNPDRLITVDTAADRLSFTPQYLYDLIRKGQFPAIREGKYLRIRESDLSAWIDRHREGLDNDLYNLYSSKYGRKRTTQNQKGTQSNSGTDGRDDRSVGKHGGAMGAGRSENIRAHCQVCSIAKKDELGTEPQR
jgi:excisionase family DNA binding protein